MSKLQTTIEALESALSDAPNTPTAWVPLRRATVEETLRVLGSVHGVLAPMKALAAELEGERQEPVLIWQRGAGELVAATSTIVLNGNGNGHVTVLPVEPDDNHVVIDPQAQTAWQRITANAPVMDARKPKAHQPPLDKPTNTWRRLPKAERLTLACAEIARIAGERTWVTQAEFDRSKPAEMPTANSLVPTLGLTWIELVCKALPAAVVPAAQPSKRKAKEPAAPAAEPFRAAAQA